MPIAVLQGLWVLQRTPRLPSPTGRAGRIGIGLGAPLRVIGVGDSIIAGTGVRDQCNSLTATYARLLQGRLQRDVEWRVHGFNGATSASVLHKLAPAVPSAHVYLLSMGVNDVTHGVEPRRFAANLEGTFELLRRKSPDAMILFGGLPPLETLPRAAVAAAIDSRAAREGPAAHGRRRRSAASAHGVLPLSAGHAQGPVRKRRLPSGGIRVPALGRGPARTLAARPLTGH